MIRVALVIPALEFSATARQSALLATRLPRDEFDVRVVAIGKSGPLEPAFREAAVQVTTLDRRLTVDCAAWCRLRQFLQEFDPHVVHTWEFDANAYGRLAAGRGARTGSGSARRLVVTETRGRTKTGWQAWLDRRLAERTARLVVNCRPLADYYIASGFPEDRIALVPWGVVVPEQPGGQRSVDGGRPAGGGEIAGLSVDERNRELSEFGLPAGARVIGYVGELTRERRGRDLVWGINLLSQLTSHVFLLAIGDGPEREGLLRFARRIGKEDVVRFPGAKEAARAFRLMNVYWCVGDEESLSCALMEALAAGLPAIVSDTPAHRELIADGETGIVVQPGDGVGLAQFSDRLLADPQWGERLGSAARARVAAEFPIERMVAAHAELYRGLATGERTGGR